MNNKKWLNIIQVVLFLVIIAAGSGAVIIGACEEKTYSELEKRELKSFPEVDLQAILSGKYESDLSDALSDHFYGRDELVTAKTWAQIFMGKREIEDIYIAGDRLIGLYKDSDFDDKQIKDNISYLTDFMVSAAGGVGADHVKLMLVPGKNTVYRYELPSYLPVSKRTDTLEEEIRDELEKKFAEAPAADEEDTEDDDDDESGDGDASTDEEGFNFDEGDPDAEGFNFDEGDPDADGFNFDEGDPDADGFNFDEGDPDAEGYSGDDADESEDSSNASSAESGKQTEKNDSAAGSDTTAASSADSRKKTEKSDIDTANFADSGKETDRSPQELASEMIVSLRPLFREKKDEYIYYLTDHHWTMRGAGYAYDELMKETGASGSPYDNSKAVSDRAADVPDGSDDYSKSVTSKVVSSDFLGTDYNRIHYYKKKDEISCPEVLEASAASMDINDSGEIKHKDSIYDEEALKTADKYNYYLSGNYSEITIRTNASSDKTLLLIKDSYSNSLIPYLCREYKTIIMIDPRYVSSSVSGYIPEGIKPDDVLIVYNEEKFMQDTHQMYLE